MGRKRGRGRPRGGASGGNFIKDLGKFAKAVGTFSSDAAKWVKKNKPIGHLNKLARDIGAKKLINSIPQVGVKINEGLDTLEAKGFGARGRGGRGGRRRGGGPGRQRPFGKYTY